MKVVGLMSGTSADGIDTALVEIKGVGQSLKIQLLGFETFPYPPGVQKRLLHVALKGKVDEICHLNFYLGELFAQAVLRLLKKYRYSPEEVGVIGSHGQTIHHLPVPRKEGRLSVRSTLQIGEAAVVAERTGIITVSDFRPGDVAAGGEGAPLTPFLHQRLFQHRKRARLVINIGGICNMTFLPAAARREGVMAFDVGPGNMLLDGVMDHYSRGKAKMDRNGKLARRGTVNASLLRGMMRHPFFEQSPPKSCGRETFGSVFLRRVLKKSGSLKLSLEDLLATLMAFTVQGIVTGLKCLPGGGDDLHEVIIGGGGVRNPALMAMIRESLAPLWVRTYEDFGLNSRAIEAMAFALLAYTTYHRIPNNIPSSTGARRSVILGKITRAGLSL